MVFLSLGSSESEAKDGSVGIDKSEEIVGLILKILNPGYLLVQINDPAQLVWFVWVVKLLLASSGDFMRLTQPE